MLDRSTRAREGAAIQSAGMAGQVLGERFRMELGKVAIRTMHLTKEFESRVVVVIAREDEVIRLQGWIDAIADNADLEEVYSTERHLLCVACTRARDVLLVTAVNPASGFLADLADEVG